MEEMGPYSNKGLQGWIQDFPKGGGGLMVMRGCIAMARGRVRDRAWKFSCHIFLACVFWELAS